MFQGNPCCFHTCTELWRIPRLSAEGLLVVFRHDLRRMSAELGIDICQESSCHTWTTHHEIVRSDVLTAQAESERSGELWCNRTRQEVARFCSRDHMFCFKHIDTGIGSNHQKLVASSLVSFTCMAPLFHPAMFVFFIKKIYHTHLLTANSAEDLLLYSHIGSFGLSAEILTVDWSEKLWRKSRGSYTLKFTYLYTASLEKIRRFSGAQRMSESSLCDCRILSQSPHV